MISEKKFSLLIRILILLFLVGGFFSVAGRVFAATLSINPSSGTHAVGESFSVLVNVSSNDQASNAIDASVSFPTDKLQVMSVSKEGSIIDLWAEEPTFSNSSGQVSISGVVLTPGFYGSAGKVLKINFKVKKAGSAAVVFSSGSVLANDGQGTNILSGFNNAQFTLGGSAVIPGEPVKTDRPPVVKVDQAEMTPIVTSPTHPDPTIWYNTNDAVFNWNLPTQVIAVRIAVDNDPFSVPHDKYPLIPSLEKKDLGSGVWYFHIRFENKNGLGETTHFRFQVDTVAPLPFEIKFPDGSSSDNSRPPVLFITNDFLSGISHYRIKIGDADFFQIKQDTDINPYILPFQKAGARDIEVEAYDRAGNMRKEKASFTVLPTLFMRTLRTVAEGILFVLLAILVLTGLYLLLLRTWRHLALLRSKAKNDVKEFNANLYAAMRKKVDDDFAAGNYLNALSGYRKLQEQAPSTKQSELSERINLTVKFFVAAENFKKASVAASHNRWQEARALLQESESVIDPKFVHYEEARELFKAVQERLMQISEEKKVKDIDIQKKLIEAQKLAQENKEKLIEEHSILTAEKEKREQQEKENEKLSGVLREKELFFEKNLENAELRIKEKELSLHKDLESAEVRIREKELAQKKAEDDALMRMREKESALNEQLRTAQASALDYERKLSEALRSFEETKIKFTEERGVLMQEKHKLEQDSGAKKEELEKEIENLRNTVKAKEVSSVEAMAQNESRIKENETTFKRSLELAENVMREKEVAFKKELENFEVKIRHKEEEYKQLEGREAEQKKAREEAEAKIREKEETIKHTKEEAERNINELKEKLSNAERLAEEAKRQLAHHQEILAVEKTKAENLRSAISQFINPNS